MWWNYLVNLPLRISFEEPWQNIYAWVKLYIQLCFMSYVSCLKDTSTKNFIYFFFFVSVQ